jgi:hypothetical protein
MVRFAIAMLLVAGLSAGARAQTVLNPNERPAPPRINPQDKEGIWLLDFTFKDPRTIVVDIPGRGKTTCWYLWYQVVNRATGVPPTGAPRFFHPQFELVTLDRNTVHVDEVLPTVQEAICKLEDPTGHLKIMNSVTIGKEPIPLSKPDAAPIPVYGVAIWSDVARRAGDTTRFSIFVSGLSNGWTVDDAGIVRRKTLQLNFKRYTDAAHQDGQDIKFVTPTEYVYRSTSVPAPQKPKPADAKPAAPVDDK